MANSDERNKDLLLARMEAKLLASLKNVAIHPKRISCLNLSASAFTQLKKIYPQALVTYLKMNEEEVKTEKKIDLLVSNLSIASSFSPETLLHLTHKLLNENGLLIFITFDHASISIAKSHIKGMDTLKLIDGKEIAEAIKNIYELSFIVRKKHVLKIAKVQFYIEGDVFYVASVESPIPLQECLLPEEVEKEHEENEETVEDKEGEEDEEHEEPEEEDEEHEDPEEDEEHEDLQEKDEEHKEQDEHEGHEEHEKHEEHKEHEEQEKHEEHKEHEEQEKHEEHKEHEEQEKHEEHKEHEEQEKHEEHKEHEEHGKHEEHKEHEEQGKHEEHKEHEERGKHEEHKEHEERGKHEEHKEHEEQGKHEEHKKHEEHDGHDEPREHETENLLEHNSEHVAHENHNDHPAQEHSSQHPLEHDSKDTEDHKSEHAQEHQTEHSHEHISEHAIHENHEVRAAHEGQGKHPAESHEIHEHPTAEISKIIDSHHERLKTHEEKIAQFLHENESTLEKFSGSTLDLGRLKGAPEQTQVLRAYVQAHAENKNILNTLINVHKEVLAHNPHAKELEGYQALIDKQKQIVENHQDKIDHYREILKNVVTKPGRNQ